MPKAYGVKTIGLRQTLIKNQNYVETKAQNKMKLK